MQLSFLLLGLDPADHHVGARLLVPGLSQEFLQVHRMQGVLIGCKLQDPIHLQGLLILVSLELGPDALTSLFSTLDTYFCLLIGSCLFHFIDSRKYSVSDVFWHCFHIREAHREVHPELFLSYVVTSCEVYIREALNKWLLIPG
jgi:hypothetical protein